MGNILTGQALKEGKKPFLTAFFQYTDIYWKTNETMIHLKRFDTHSQYSAFTETTDFIKPNVSVCESEQHVHYNPYVHDYSQDYLTFIAMEDNVDIIFYCYYEFESNYQTVSYSLDNGETWSETEGIEGENHIATLSNGDKVLIKGTNSQYGEDIEYKPSQFRIYGNTRCEGNIMSLIYGDNFIGMTAFPQGSMANFAYLFSDCNIIDASNLILPATILTQYCYTHMFDTASIITAPSILPATTLANQCYCNMFINCGHLITPPELPADTMTYWCYQGMFAYCTSLTTAPELPATTLADYCYGDMFSGCASLNYIKAMFTTTPSTSYTSNWVNGVAATGTFVKNSAAEWDATGVDGIPTGWTVETASA